MKKFFITLGIFMLFTLLIYPAFIWIAGSTAPLYLRKNLNHRIGAYGHMFSRMKDVKHVSDVDLVFLGSSHAYRGFDTRIFSEQGISSFNLGSSSQTPIQTKLLIDKYLDKLNPELVIFEVYPEIFCIDGVESSLDFVANEEIDCNTLEMVVRVNHIATYNSYLYSLIWQQSDDWETYSEPVIKDEDSYIKGGGYVAREITPFKNTAHPPHTFVINEKQWKMFKAVIGSIKNRNIELLLVQAPVTRQYYQSVTNKEEMDSLLSAAGNYINYNGKLPLDDNRHFYDKDHLNQHGVALFNDHLINYIKANKLLVK